MVDHPAAAKIREWRERPRQMVEEVFGATPDVWQGETLDAFPHNPRVAMKAAKGPGKSTVMSWLAWNFLLTRLHPNIGATSISGDNLRDGLWKEMAVWRNKSPLLLNQFEVTSERIYHREHKNTWFMTARTWSKAATVEELGATVAGLHADNIMFLIDEAGAVPVAILAAAEGILSSAKEGHLVIAGNTNSLDGALYTACVRQASLWKVVIITSDPDDPNRSPRVDIGWATDMIRNYGRDSPFIKVMILGEWPAASINALIGAGEVEEAMKRCYRQEDIARSPRILGVDVARHGLAKSVIMPRQGLVMFKPHRMVNVNSVEGAARVARTWADWDANACFIDATGGFGAGWIDQLQILNHHPVGVQFSQQALEKERYFNKRAEMYFTWVQWIRNGGWLPNVPELVEELPAMTYTFKGDRLLLEPKELVEVKVGHSPDDSDAGALTFAAPVAPRLSEDQQVAEALTALRSGRQSDNYDPFEEFLGGRR